MFTPAPFVSFRSVYSLRSHLVGAKVYLLIGEKGWTCCGKSRCETCFNIKETDTFQSFVTKEVYKIYHHFHCDSKCITYLISCKVCNLQFITSQIPSKVEQLCIHKGFHEELVLPKKTTSVNIFWVRIIMEYLMIVR